MSAESRKNTLAVERPWVNPPSSLRVAVVGLGALGNEVVKSLGMLGIRQFLLIDPDRVEARNYETSLFYRGVAVGTPKASAMRSMLHRYFDGASVEALEDEVADVGWGQFQSCDLIFGCVDRDSARLEMARIATRLTVPICDGGLGGEGLARGRVSYFASASACFGCRLTALSRRAILRDWSSAAFPCLGPQEPERMSSTPALAGITANAMVEIGFRNHASGVTQSVTTEYHFEDTPRAESFVIPMSEACPFHEPPAPLAPVPATFAEAGALVSWEWAQCVGARCRDCRHQWMPGVRLAKFRRSGRCPLCHSPEVLVLEALSSVRRGSDWAEKTPSDLGLPANHRYTVGSP